MSTWGKKMEKSTTFAAKYICYDDDQERTETTDEAVEGHDP